MATIDDLVASTTALTTAVNVSKATLDAKVTAASGSAVSAAQSVLDAKAQADVVAASANLVLPAKVNSIGAPGGAGFGVGICPIVPAGFVALPGATDPAHANYGNYMYQDGSIMCWIPKFWYRVAHASNPTYGVHGVNSVDVRGLETFSSTVLANASGYAIHRMFIDGDVEKSGCFVDKYKCSENVWGTGRIASSIANGNPISTAYDHNTIANLTAVRTAHPATKAITAATKAANCQITITGHSYVVGQRFAISAVVGMTELNGLVAQVVSVVDANNVTVNINSTAFTTYTSAGTCTAGTNAYYSAITAAKARDGVNGAVNASSMFFCTTRFITAGLALLALAHGQASSATTYCAWYSAGATNFPKGCNNNALKDVNDTAVTYQTDGYSNCGKTGSAGYGGGVGNTFAKTTHNGQASGVADLNGLMYDINPGLTCITSTKAITGISQANPAVVTATAHGLVNGQQIVISGVVGMTQVNTCVHTVANVTANTFELSGVNSTGYTAYTSGGTITLGTFYVYKKATAAKSLGAGNTLSTDVWGATGVAAHSDVITVPMVNGGCGMYFGNAANQVLSEATAGDPWQLAGLGFPKDGNGVSAAGSSLFGNDYFYEYFINDMVPISSFHWNNAAGTGVWGVSLTGSRPGAGNNVGFRSACYPA
jgi:hypothetical protein